MKAMPLAEQAAHLKNSLDANRSAVESLEGQIGSMQQRMKDACAEGLAMERELGEVNAQIISPQSPPSGSLAQPNMSMDSALGMVGGLAGVLPPETGVAFAECVRQLQLMLAQEGVARTVPSYRDAAQPPSASAPSRPR